MNPSLSFWPLAALLGVTTGCTRPPAESRLGDAAAQAAPATQRGAKTRERAARIVRREEVPNGVTDAEGIRVPRGFRVNIFAEGLRSPRRLVIAPFGNAGKFDVFVSESRANRVRVLRESNGDGRADGRFIFTNQAEQPYGLAFHPAGWLYVANTDSVVRFPYRPGSQSAKAAPQFITRLTRGGYNQHWTRNLIFSPDFKQLFVTVGSSCNTCEEDDAQRAAISVMNPDGKARRIFASGLRNPVGLDWRPGTGELWTAVNERDRLGDDTPPDYLTLVRTGAFHGWPYAYSDLNGNILPDPTFGPDNPAKVARTVPPDVPVQAHSAALGVVFYPQFSRIDKTPNGRFPPDYSGDAFLAFHGSWNRSAKTGYKIVRVDFQNGRPASVTDFVRGFLRGSSAWGRPVDIAVAPDGSLLFSDDDGGKIWRVSYAGNS